MKYLLSMDGGGSKTAWLLTDENGIIAAQCTTEGGSRPQLEVEEILERTHDGIQQLLDTAGVAQCDLLAAAFGVPCYGEYPDTDKIILDDLTQTLAPAFVGVYNDVELGFAGSLALEDGIHVVAGTGSIAIGRNAAGETARSNGWSPFFSDDGSGYWLGMQTLNLFTKQSDGRIPRGALYHIVRKHFSLADDMDITAYYDEHLSVSRKKTAAVQLLLKEAAEAGDPSAIDLYARAAQELMDSVRALWQVLGYTPADTVKVSYSGGLFYEGNFILPVLTQLAQPLGAQMTKPQFSPVWGGILLAMQLASPERAKLLRSTLVNT